MRQNLILVHSYPTNSLLLSGLIEYLSDTYNVFFIDLPGFVKEKPPLKEITFENYSKYVSEKIEQFGLEEYYIGGISFGFLVVNNAKLDSRCKGIMAIEPYTDAISLSMTPFGRFILFSMLEPASRLRLSRPVWTSRWFRALFPKYIFTGHSKSTTDIILDIDADTFVETARIILKNRDICRFRNDIPYALIINEKDESVKSEYLINLFKTNIKKLLIVSTDVEHYPKGVMSKEYFAAKLSLKTLEEINAFFK